MEQYGIKFSSGQQKHEYQYFLKMVEQIKNDTGLKFPDDKTRINYETYIQKVQITQRKYKIDYLWVEKEVSKLIDEKLRAIIEKQRITKTFEIYIKEETFRQQYEQLIVQIEQIHKQFNIRFKTTKLVYIYVKMIVQKERIMSITNCKFDSEQERQEYEELMNVIVQIERESNIIQITQDFKTKYIEYLKVIIQILESSGMRFTSQTEKQIYIQLIQEITVYERNRQN